MATIYNYISLASYILAILFLVIAVIMFFRYDIRKIIGDLSGRNARKSVEAMKKKVVEKEDTSTSLGSRMNRDVTTEKLGATTAKINEDEDATVYLDKSEDATVYLEEDSDATMYLEDEDATMYLDKEEDATVHLDVRSISEDEDDEQTQILSVEPSARKSGFVIEREITLVHTDKYLL